jgi:predicted lipoprotein with Yx(FWY)xxD motif
MSRTRVLAPVLLLVAVAGVIAFLLATGGGSATTPASTSGAAAISTAQTSLGTVLVDANGRTLYLFEGDRPNTSTLSAAGRAIWPPYTSATKPRAGGGALAGQIGTIPGSGQVTYKGHPLYYYVGDQKPGQTTGQGLNQFGALWYVLSAQGSAITSADPASSGPGSSYGY